MYRVLYIDDEPDLLELVKIVLEETKEFIVHLSTNATEILKSDDLHSYDVITPMITNPVSAIVPKDTGRLRATILQSIQGNSRGMNGTYSRLGNLHPFTVVINTGKVKYAAIVNEMPSEWLKHFGFGHNGSTNMNNKQYQHKWKPKQKTPHKLMDPGAETDWFGKLVNAGQQIWQTLCANYIRGDFARYFTNTITRSNTGLRMSGQVYLDLLSITTLLWNRGVP